MPYNVLGNRNEDTRLLSIRDLLGRSGEVGWWGRQDENYHRQMQLTTLLFTPKISNGSGTPGFLNLCTTDIWG
jgi:hypothetical protein